MSETDFVDSTSAMLVIALTAAPTSGSCTNTTSPRASWAKSVIPTRARPPSTATHSCSFVYRNRSGSSMSGCLSQNLADATRVLLGELAGVLVALPFGPYVGQRFLGIGQHEGPAVGMQHLDPVHEHDVTGAGALDHLAHDRSLALPRCRHRLVGDVQSNAGMKSGQMKPPSWEAAKSTLPADATSMRCGADSFVQVMVAPRSDAMRSASRVTETGNATWASAVASVTSVRRASNPWSLSSAWPSSSIMVAVSPSGSMTTPS